MTDEHDDTEGYSVFDEERETANQPDEREETPASLEGSHDRGCPKCGHEGSVTDEISTTGSGLLKFLDIQNRRFTVVSCENCSYSELYRGRSSGDVIDVFLG